MGRTMTAVAKQNASSAERTWWRELFRADLYKRSQGRIARQATFASIAVVFALAAMRLYDHWTSFPAWWRRMFPGDLARYGFAFALFVAGAWFAYRIVNFPRFADFLISVEAEMNKVSWPSRSELVRSSIVVIVVIGLLVVILFGFDFFLRLILGQWLGIIRTG